MSDSIGMTAPQDGALIRKDTEFVVSAHAQFARVIEGQARGYWEFKDAASPVFVPCTSETLIRAVDRNPFPISQEELEQFYDAHLATTSAVGIYQLRVRVLRDSDHAVLVASAPVSIAVTHAHVGNATG